MLGVCRRVTGDVHLADDAFQAAWLVLARKPEAATELRGFLYGVAVNVSRRARRGQRRRRERLPGRLPDVPATNHTADPEAVPNGIAWDRKARRLYVTGKLWPKVFRIAWPAG